MEIRSGRFDFVSRSARIVIAPRTLRAFAHGFVSFGRVIFLARKKTSDPEPWGSS